MSKKAKLLRIIAIAVCVCLIVGVLYLANEIFPKAKPLSLPDSASISAITIEKAGVSDTDSAKILEYLTKCKPTRRQSMDDTPTERPYYCISIRTDNAEHRYFVYVSNTKTYVEEPYTGIYKAPAELLELVTGYCRSTQS